MCRDESVYQFELSFGESSAFHTMTVDSAFSHANICLNNSDKYHNIALSSLLHILFSMAILPHGGIMTHASCVIQDCKGFMFLGKSGTGKVLMPPYGYRASPTPHSLMMIIQSSDL